MTAVSAPPARSWRARAAWPVGLVLIVIAAAVLTGWQVSASMSDYYGAVAMSMSKSWSNLFFGAFDPAGTVSLDKIPGSFWIPALAVRVFGFSPAAVILPNAIAATAAAAVTAFTARRLVGTTGGLLAAAVVATTPILVAVARSNQPQAFFVLALALVAWAAVRAIQQRSLGWYLLAGALIGVAFQTYMLEACAVWPALAAAYLCTRQPWWRRIWHTLLAGAVTLVVSLTWVAVVWLVPASDRPYVGGTNGNNPWEMVFGYNGLGRFSATADSDAYRSFTPAFAGDPGPLRLFNTELAGQIPWLLPATVAAIVVLFILRWRPATVVFLGGWFATEVAMFSVVAGMHQFYTSALAIPVALLVAAAFAVARSRRLLWPQVLLVAVAAITAVMIAAMYPEPSPVLAWVQAAIAAVAILLLVLERRAQALRSVTAVAAVIALLLTPAAWSVLTIGAPSSINPTAAGVSQMPGGGGGFGGSRPGGATFGGSAVGARPHAPDGGAQTGARGGMPPTGAAGGASSNAALLLYLTERQGDAKYLVATFGAQSAAQLILGSHGGSVLPIGGFDGSDDVPTLAAFQQMVADGEVTYVLGSGAPGAGAGSTRAASTATKDISAWVTSACTLVADAPAGATLYSCTAG
ncbi:4-amino-4-deoxy-L-arabinose transferase-like glycosyltransferase [Microbacterium sp. SORGH_AS428]|uniref:ArnT family glycosyltransferase n=1 Tax=Microbacterium sp. SORGH_AS_0428 TaxID=3041788 RepID=UPI00285C8923|nr:glycosyltransferase family 39 protein [Microbacterium sp. SORGH_AS_0428]MDR6198135.1 4-amino-4-deoxy-L-arabinose transferase-like glycosyltransferase [Microbacterium sp. SORGH_AS_0428]